MSKNDAPLILWNVRVYFSEANTLLDGSGHTPEEATADLMAKLDKLAVRVEKGREIAGALARPPPSPAP